MTISSFCSIDCEAQCGCDHIIANNTYKIDGNVLGIQPGDKVCFSNGTRGAAYFVNINGTEANPILITNRCDGEILFTGPKSSPFSIEFHKSKHFRISGSGNPSVEYGIEITGTHFGIDLKGLSTNFEVDHLRLDDLGYAGISAKTDPSCDPATWRGNFLMEDIILHDNYITNTGGEGFYVGESHYHRTVAKTCGGSTLQLEEHEVRNVKIYNNRLENIGRDAIQLGATTTGGEIYDNYVYNYGTKGVFGHKSGVQINPGTAPIVRNNLILVGTGFGVFADGVGGTIVKNNIIANALEGGIFAKDEGASQANGKGLWFINNTLVNNNDYGIYTLSENTVDNQFINNIIIGTSQSTFKYVRLNNPSAIDWNESNNVFTKNIGELKFQDAPSFDFRLLAGSSAIDVGLNAAIYGVIDDYDYNSRPSGSIYDVGAYEKASALPEANAGPNKTITLPTNSVILNGSGTTPNTSITSYAWTKQSGGAATLQNANTATLTVTDLVQGTYQFQLKITDNTGATATDLAQVIVQALVNQNPTVNAGTDKTVTLPTSTLNITGVGSDPDGSISSYSWIQLNGPTVTILGASTATLQLSSLTEGTFNFRLTVTDNIGATASDDVKVTVNPATVNQVPTVNAGSDKVINLPTNTIVINGIASDPDGSISNYLWEKRSGPAASLININTANITANSLVEGVYIFRLTVTDNQGATSFDEVQVTVSAANQAPIANAGANKFLTLPTNSTVITGSGSDNDGSIASYSWTKVSGLTATLTNTASASLTIANMAAGVHTFGLTVTDNDGATGYDEVQVTVNTAPINQLPVANAGLDQSITLPANTIILNGSGSDNDGSISAYLWTKVSGPSATLTGAQSTTLTVSDMLAGTYTFRLQVTDNQGSTDIDDVLVTVFPSGTNQPPVANAGGNKSINLPTNSTTIIGAGSDPDGNISSFNWSKVSGPAANLSQNQNSLSVSNMVEGIYLFKLEVTDNEGALGSDFATINVKSSNLPPTVSAGDDITLVLPSNSLTIEAVANDLDGNIISYEWSKELGGPATLTSTNSEVLGVSALVEGSYQFKIIVTDDDGSTAIDVVNVSVLSSGSNVPPSLTLIEDIVVFLPTSILNVTAFAEDSDGSISTYNWVKLSGPSSTLSNINSATLTISNLLIGTSEFQITVTDDDGAASSGIVRITVNPSGSNQPPIANAGGNKNIQLPTNSVILSGTASDNDGTISTYKWDKLSGPVANIVNDNTATATISSLVEGAYRIRLTVVDNSGASAFDELIINVLPESINQSPIADAGSNRTIILPQNSTNLIGIGSDNDGAIASYKWSKVSGPTTLTLTNSNTPVASVADLVEGVYIFKLVVIDNDGASASDDVQITVSPIGSNIPPSADAGGNQVLYLPNSNINLFGSGSDPDGSISSYLWTKISGGTATLTNNSTPTLSLSSLAPGNYTFRLRVTDDKGATNDDFVNVIVNAESVNLPPLVNAGSDKTIYLPSTSTTIIGAASDQDGSIIDKIWSQTAGATLSLTNPNNNNLTISDLTEGTFTLRFTATDDKQSSAFDETSVLVLAEGSNVPPLVNLGEDIELFLPLDSYSVEAVAQDLDGDISTFIWSKVSGPSVTFSNTSEKDLTISDLAEGQLLLQLNVIDNEGASAFDQILITIHPIGTNQPPIVNAGSDTTIYLPNNKLKLKGTAVDNDGNINNILWSKISGGNFLLSGETTLEVEVSDLDVGTYIFKLEATDDSNVTTSDEIVVQVDPTQPNNPPNVDVGINKSIIVPQSNVTFVGSAQDSDGTVESYLWTQVSGSPVNIIDVTSSSMTVENMTETGLYNFKLSATDNEGAVGSNNVLVFGVLSEDNRKQPPLVFAGEDKLILLPDDSFDQLGEAFDPDGQIEVYNWELIEGDNALISFTDTLLTVQNLKKGEYKFRFTVVDEDSLSASDDFVVKVKESIVIESPKFFSPNNDGISDTWVIENLDLHGSCKIQIFNRSGQRVFQANPYLNDWNGTFNGQELKEGDYYYILSCDDGVSQSGALRIIK